ncbi:MULTISPECIES: hypothetical protein [Enterococcus]|uniref:hypothetical protein n=1 Tax=Enterococcus TaxID=1350 RepID=UPI0024152946|nr:MULTISPECIES: hypothetical protein [Enterococcus]MDG4615609.1 hypothetical protein [Enterococcus lactis]MEB4749199.1 hypothetical protein [Enterococcus sp. E5-162]HAQ5734459.1 hypothetical protein [Enterococcus faecium]
MGEALNQEIHFINTLSYYSDYINLNDLLIELRRIKDKHKTTVLDPILTVDRFSEISNFMKKTAIPLGILRDLNDSLVKHIIYHSVSHIYMYNINTPLTIETIEKKLVNNIDSLTGNWSDTAQANIAEGDMYYNLIDSIAPSHGNEIYYPAFFKTSSNINLFSVFRAVTKTGDSIIIPSLAVLDTNKSILMILIPNKFRGRKSDDVVIWSPESYCKILISKISMICDISIKKIDDSYERALKKNLFTSCVKMNRKLVEDYEDQLLEKMPPIKKHINNIITNIGKVVCLTRKDKEKIEKKILSTCVSEYMTKAVKPTDLQKKALEKGLQGYPTKIKFDGLDSSSGGTRSSSRNSPLPIHEIFHSINTSFVYFGTIKECRIAWFNKYLFPDKEEFINKSSVSQANIKISSDRVFINIMSKTNKNEVMINYVISEVIKIIDFV